MGIIRTKTVEKTREFLVQEGLIDSNLLISVLKELLDIESIFLEGTEIDTLATKMVPENICKDTLYFHLKLMEIKYV